MQEEPLITIITPVYNGAPYIQETIDSVFAQTYLNWEWHIIDDGSEDNTRELVLANQDQRIHLDAEPHSGLPSVVRNVGLRKAQGKYIAFLDADDLWEIDKLTIQVNTMEKDRSLLFTSSHFSCFPSSTTLKRFHFRNRRLSFRDLLTHYLIANSTVLMRSSVLDMIGYLDEDPRLKAVEDFDYWLRILDWQDNSCMVLKKVLMRYRLHEANISALKNETNSDWLDRVSVIFAKYRDKRPIDFKLAERIARETYKISRLRDELNDRKVSYFRLILSGDYNLRTKAALITEMICREGKKHK